MQNILNLLGLILGMIGSFMMYYFTPKVNSQLYLYRESEMNKLREKDVHRNKMIRLGMFLLFVGFVSQAIALIINFK